MGEHTADMQAIGSRTVEQIVIARVGAPFVSVSRGGGELAKSNIRVTDGVPRSSDLN